MKKFPDYHFDRDGVTIQISMKRTNTNLARAQMWLEQQIMNDMLPVMPLRTGNFQQRTRALNTVALGSGQVWAAAPPYGRVRYGGQVMVDPATGSPWARKGAKKVLTDRDLTFSRGGAVARWFEAIKPARLPSWKAGVAKIINGGVTPWQSK